MTDILKLQGEVARAIAEEIQVRLTAEERARLTSPGAVNPAAYLEYLLGQHYLWRLNEEDLTRAIEHFDRAIGLDASYAAAHAGLSHAWWWRGVWGAKTPKQVMATITRRCTSGAGARSAARGSARVDRSDQVLVRLGLVGCREGFRPRPRNRPEQP